MTDTQLVKHFSRIERKDNESILSFIENNFGLWTLEINNLLPIDAGEYIALATNRMGRSCSKANLHILQKNFEEG